MSFRSEVQRSEESFRRGAWDSSCVGMTYEGRNDMRGVDDKLKTIQAPEVIPKPYPFENHILR